MIVNGANVGEVVTSKGVESHAVTIKATGKAFRAMLDGIYKDKPGSIVRELYTNGLDGQRVRGNIDRPLTIHLPNVYEPFFSIRDYGCSMSPAQIQKVYGVLFESSKDQSNDQAGGFGLGGKNFLSYQDSGTIICYLNGQKYDYVLMYGPDGTPRIYSMGVSDTDEEDGVYVEVAVKANDHHLFSTAVTRQLRWLDVKPVLNNNANEIAIKSPSFAHDYGRFKTFDNDYSNPKGFWIVQGQVGYPIDLNQIRERIINRNALEFFNAFNGGALFFDIGQIQVTLGREDIQYDDSTMESIEGLITELAPVIAKEVKDKVESLPHLWQKLQYLSSSPSIFRIAKLADIPLNMGNTKCYATSSKYQIDASFLSSPDKRLAFSEFKNGKRAYFKNSVMINPDNNIKIFVRDIGRGAIARMRYYENMNYTKNYMVEHHQGAEHITDAMIADFSDRLGGLEVVRVSSLPEVPKEARINRGSPLVYQRGAGDNFEKISKWDRIYDEDEIENGYYVTFDTYPTVEIKYDTKNIINNAFSTNDLDEDTIVIYAIKSSKKHLFEDNPNFIKLEDKAAEVMETVKARWANKPFIKRYVLARKIKKMLEHIIDECALDQLTNKDKLQVINDPNSYFGRLLQVYRICHKYEEMIDDRIVEKLEGLDEILFRSNEASEYNNVVMPELSLPTLADARSRYPQLSWAKDRYYNRNDARSAEILQYIDFMDKVLTEQVS